MDFIVAALLLLCFQQFDSPAKSGPDTNLPAIVSLLDGHNSSVDAIALTGQVIDVSPTWGEGVRLTVQVESARGAPVEGLVSLSLRETS